MRGLPELIQEEPFQLSCFCLYPAEYTSVEKMPQHYARSVVLRHLSTRVNPVGLQVEFALLNNDVRSLVCGLPELIQEEPFQLFCFCSHPAEFILVEKMARHYARFVVLRHLSTGVNPVGVQVEFAK